MEEGDDTFIILQAIDALSHRRSVARAIRHGYQVCASGQYLQAGVTVFWTHLLLKETAKDEDKP